MLTTRDHLDHLCPSLTVGDRVYLTGDLGSGKTTLVGAILSAHFGHPIRVKSPTYTYYTRYDTLYHFDLYRLTSYEEFVRIGGEDILDDPTNICLIEWPELLFPHFSPTISIVLRTVKGHDDVRDITVERHCPR